MQTFSIEATAIEISPSGRMAVNLQFDAEPKDVLAYIAVNDILSSVDADYLLEGIGRDAAMKYWDLTDAEA